MRIIIIFLICAIMHGAVNAATCDAGYYLENGECKDCNLHTNINPSYCPGDDTRHACPTTDTDYEKLSGWTIIKGYEAHHARENASSVNHCTSSMQFRDSHGNEVLVECPFNGENYWCNHRLWFAAGNGYYLSNYWMTSFKVWYYDVKQCNNAPANAHYTGPGTPDALDGSIVDANDCPWECDAEYGKSALGECLPLCAGGATKFHAGAHVFNVWRDKYTSPTLKVQLSSGAVCHINLAPGLARGTINVDYNGQTYHVVN